MSTSVPALAAALMLGLAAGPATGGEPGESGTSPVPDQDQAAQTKESTPAAEGKGAAREARAAAPGQQRVERPAGVRVAEITICRDVAEKAPQDQGTSFPADVGMLACFTDVREAGAPREIVHKWYVGDQLVSEVPMEVRGPRWRCWSKKEILPEWKGNCRVEVLSASGDLIAETQFALVEPASAAAQAAPAKAAEPGSKTRDEAPAEKQTKPATDKAGSRDG